MMLYNDYVAAIENTLSQMDLEQCRNLLRNMAYAKGPEERISFLNLLEKVSKNPEGNRIAILASTDPRRMEKLIEKAKDFCQRVEEGMCLEEEDDEPWYDDWSSPEPVYGEWQEEVRLLLDEAVSIAREGFSIEAAEVLTLLLTTLIGDDVDVLFEDTLIVTLNEAVPVYLNTLIQTLTQEELHQSFWEAIQKSISLVGLHHTRLELVHGANRIEPSRWEKFIWSWVQYLDVQQGPYSRKLYLDALFHREGLEGLLTLARETGNGQPDLWLHVLTEMNRHEESSEQIGRLCFEMLHCHGFPVYEPKSLDLDIADDQLSVAARALVIHGANRLDWMATGLKTLALLRPVVSHLADWFAFLWENKPEGEVDWQTAVKSFFDHPALKSDKTGKFLELSAEDRRISHQFLQMLDSSSFHPLLDSGKGSPYGWSDGNDTSLRFAWGLMFLLHRSHQKLSMDALKKRYPQAALLWELMIEKFAFMPQRGLLLERSTDGLRDGDSSLGGTESETLQRRERIESMLLMVMNHKNVEETACEAFEKWCKKTALSRMKFILENKYRGAYERAALALFACAGMVEACHGRDEGFVFVMEARKPYLRYNAFSAEYRAQLDGSPWYRSNPV